MLQIHTWFLSQFCTKIFIGNFIILYQYFVVCGMLHIHVCWIELYAIKNAHEKQFTSELQVLGMYCVVQ